MGVLSNTTDTYPGNDSSANGDHIFAVTAKLLGDLTGEGDVNLLDIAELGSGWQTVYTMHDLVNIASDWLK